MTLPGRSAIVRGWSPLTINLPEGGRMTAFDERLDKAFERLLRNRRVPDMVMYAASALGDHGLLWLALAGVQAGRHRHGNWRRPLIRAAAGLGLESALVNGPVKWVFRRSRPIHDGPRPLHLRQPRTSSFPSGHATAAFFAASLLGEDDFLRPLYYALAVVVAASRLHVKIHHASDVVGGAIIGAVLGEIVRRAVPIEAPAPAAPAGPESPAP
ncbi:MAG: phosphatase PAP2 family protein [Acidimicrobiales bacterium]